MARRILAVDLPNLYYVSCFRTNGEFLGRAYDWHALKTFVTYLNAIGDSEIDIHGNLPNLDIQGEVSLVELGEVSLVELSNTR